MELIPIIRVVVIPGVVVGSMFPQIPHIIGHLSCVNPANVSAGGDGGGVDEFNRVPNTACRRLGDGSQLSTKMLTPHFESSSLPSHTPGMYGVVVAVMVVVVVVVHVPHIIGQLWRANIPNLPSSLQSPGGILVPQAVDSFSP